jgi:ribosome-binding factor A
MADRMDRINALLMREIGEAFSRLITEAGFNRAAVTLTHVETSRNLRNASVGVSVRGTPHEQAFAMQCIRRARPAIQKAINTDLHIKYTPVLHFQLDQALQKGDHVLAVLDELAHKEPHLDEMPDTEQSEDDAHFQ